MNIRPLALAAACFATAASFAPAVAAESSRSSVEYSDLDLSTESGRTELAQRFDNAAREACNAPQGELKGKDRYCYQSTSKSLRKRVAAIIADYEAKGG